MKIIPGLLLLLMLLPSVSANAQQLSAAEEADLLYSREEEKLARDVYQFLYGQWELPLFYNISVSEQRHMDALLTLLNLYGLDDPIGNNPAGVFSNATLQAWYDELVADASVSVVAALEAGVAIEEADIADLEIFLGNTEEAALIRVYNNLLKGSNNHLAAFVNNLEAQGGSYPGGNQAGSSASPGTAVYDPIAQTLYIPALDVDFGDGNVVVYDALLRLVETLPQTMQAVTATATTRQPNPDVHASFNAVTGELLIRDLVVGSIQVDGVNNTHYRMTLRMDMNDVDAAVFSVESISAI